MIDGAIRRYEFTIELFWKTLIACWRAKESWWSLHPERS